MGEMCLRLNAGSQDIAGLQANVQMRDQLIGSLQSQTTALTTTLASLSTDLQASQALVAVREQELRDKEQELQRRDNAMKTMAIARALAEVCVCVCVCSTIHPWPYSSSAVFSGAPATDLAGNQLPLLCCQFLEHTTS